MVRLSVEAVLPKVQSDPKKFERDLKKRYKRLQSQIRRDFKKTVRNWEKKPKFFVKRRAIKGGFAFDAGTDNEVYRWLNEGTDPYIIRAKNAPRLVFRVPYSAQSTPRTLKSRRGGFASDAEIRTAKSVKHPGIEAREWTRIIAERFQEKVVEEGNKALQEYLKDRRPPNVR